jgi:hypothetical protein
MHSLHCVIRSKSFLPTLFTIPVLDCNASDLLCTEDGNASHFCMAVILSASYFGLLRCGPNATELPSHSINTLDE